MKKRHYPSHVTVGKAKYALMLVPHLEETRTEETRGYCEVKDKLIVLKNTLSEKELFSTFLHEAIHAIEEEHGIKLPHNTVHDLEGPLAEFLLKNFHVFPRR